jgi:TM2 domain-containing membrane protein YozV
VDVPTPPAIGADPRTDGWTEPGADVPWSAAMRGVRAPHRLPRERSAAWAGLLGWLVPGFGQVYLGRYGAGFLLLLVIGSTFAGGLALTDFTCVDPRTYQLEFVAQGLIGGPTALALVLTQDVHLARMPPWIEVGRLYVVVAGFLNLVALCDALGECWRRNARIQALGARLAVRRAGPVWDDATFPALSEVEPALEPLPDSPLPGAAAAVPPPPRAPADSPSDSPSTSVP